MTTRGHHRSRSKRKPKGRKKAREQLARQYEGEEEERPESNGAEDRET